MKCSKTVRVASVPFETTKISNQRVISLHYGIPYRPRASPDRSPVSVGGLAAPLPLTRFDRSRTAPCCPGSPPRPDVAPSGGAVK